MLRRMGRIVGSITLLGLTSMAFAQKEDLSENYPLPFSGNGGYPTELHFYF
jgi:hypothetical protein